MAKEIKIPMGDTYMNVIQFGTGKKILSIIAGVSLAGLEGSGEGVAQAYDMFAEDFTVYLFDRKKVLPDGYSVAEMAEDVYYCLKELGVAQTDVYGVSQGGMIGQCLAIQHPEMVHKLVICSSMCRPTPLIQKVAEGWKNAALSTDIVRLNRLFFKDVYSEAFLASVKDLLPTLEQVGTPEDCKRFLVLVEACLSFQSTDQLPLIQCPVLVIGDSNDHVIGPEGSYEIAEKLHCEIKMYDQYSHAIYDEAPEVKTLLKEFLQN